MLAGEQVPRRIGRQRQPRDGNVSRHAGRHRAVGDGREAKQIAVHDLLSVDRQRGGQPNARVIERRAPGIEHQPVGENERIIANHESRVPAHERGMLWTDTRKVELSRDQRRQLDHRLIDNDDDESIDVRRAAQRGWEVGILREHPTAVCLVGNEAKRAIADRARVPGGRPELRVGNVVQQVSRQDREIGEDVWNMIGGRRRPEPQLYR